MAVFPRSGPGAGRVHQRHWAPRDGAGEWSFPPPSTRSGIAASFGPARRLCEWESASRRAWRAAGRRGPPIPRTPCGRQAAPTKSPRTYLPPEPAMLRCTRETRPAADRPTQNDPPETAPNRPPTPQPPSPKRRPHSTGVEETWSITRAGQFGI